MSTVLNDRDSILQAATVRIVNPKNAWINLQPSVPGFHVNAAGQADVSVVTVTADLVGLDDAVAFSAVGATLSNAVGRSVDVTYAGQTAILTAKVVSNGDEFKRSLVIPVLRDGASGTGTPGAPGARGAGHYYATGSTWSDVVAQAACPGSTPVLNDVVTISSSTYVMEKRWTGSAWVENGVVINGKLIAPDSILASSIDTRGLSIKDAAGNVILSAGTSLAEQTPSSPNLAARISSWTMSGNAFYATAGSGDSRFINGEYLYLPANQSLPMGTSNPLSIPANGVYTVSFDAYVDSGTKAVNVDVYGAGIDSVGTYETLTTAIKRYRFTETMPNSASAPSCQLRVFSVSGAGNIVVSNIKVEMGSAATSWSDNVITKRNVSTFIKDAAIGLALIDRATIANLQALVAYLGTVEIGAGGALRQGQTAYDTGVGIHLGADTQGNPSFSMRAASGKYLRIRPSSDTLEMNGGDLIGTRISQPQYDTFAYSALGGGYVQGPNNQILGNSVTLVINGNNGPFKVTWSYSRLSGGPPMVASYIDQNPDRDFGIGVGPASNTTISFQVNAVITAADGRTLNYSDVFVFQFGNI